MNYKEQVLDACEDVCNLFGLFSRQAGRYPKILTHLFISGQGDTEGLSSRLDMDREDVSFLLGRLMELDLVSVLPMSLRDTRRYGKKGRESQNKSRYRTYILTPKVCELIKSYMQKEKVA